MDDSRSMLHQEGGLRIKNLQRVIDIIASVYTLTDDQVIPYVKFINSKQSRRNVTNKEASEITASHTWQGGVCLGSILRKRVLAPLVIGKYMEKPLLVITVTGGTVTEEASSPLKTVLKECINQSHKDYKGPDSVAFHFMIVGNGLGGDIENVSEEDGFADYVDSDRFSNNNDIFNEEEKWQWARSVFGSLGWEDDAEVAKLRLKMDEYCAKHPGLAAKWHEAITVVAIGGWSETWSDPTADRRLWSEGSGYKVNTVILIKMMRPVENRVKVKMEVSTYGQGRHIATMSQCLFPPSVNLQHSFTITHQQLLGRALPPALFAFWLRSSVVSVLFSLISETVLWNHLLIILIFAPRGRGSVLAHPQLHCVTSIALSLVDATLLFSSFSPGCKRGGEENLVTSQSVERSEPGKIVRQGLCARIPLLENLLYKNIETRPSPDFKEPPPGLYLRDANEIYDLLDVPEDKRSEIVKCTQEVYRKCDFQDVRFAKLLHDRDDDNDDDFTDVSFAKLLHDGDSGGDGPVIPAILTLKTQICEIYPDVGQSWFAQWALWWEHTKPISQPTTAMSGAGADSIYAFTRASDRMRTNIINCTGEVYRAANLPDIRFSRISKDKVDAAVLELGVKLLVRKVYNAHLKNIDVQFEKIPKGPMKDAMDDLKQKLPDVFELCEGDWFGFDLMEEATKIWGAFEKARGEFEEVEDEDRARDAEDDEWGIGELEQVEGGRTGKERGVCIGVARRE
ncbi:hypothetical protein Q9L58_008804 [Maublancomyces gigas]|uniref:Uncharacterized protein n=1 Tax=Discina gigas TaxID=1032678 RepID=A0ABR3G8P3_9PEZI